MPSRLQSTLQALRKTEFERRRRDLDTFDIFADEVLCFHNSAISLSVVRYDLERLAQKGIIQRTKAGPRISYRAIKH